jgi:UDP-glucose 4-epimerase
MKFFITGGAGFIGINLTNHLIKKGNLVTIFDNLSNSTENNVTNLKSKNVKFVKGDILNLKLLEEKCIGHDIIIHLAAQISVQESIRNPENTMKINVEGTKNVFHACINNKIKNIIVISSAAVYGNECPKNNSLNEESGCKPLSPYGKSKLEMENWLRNNIKETSLNCIILRFFNIYGIGQTKEYAGVISKFSEHIKNDSPITVYGKGDQTRDFISIDDVIKSILQAVSNIDNKKAEIFNIATGISTSINELAKIMLKISGTKNKINHVDPKSGDILFSKTDVTKAQKYFKFNAKISLEEGIKKYWNSF